jgi:cytosine deaminase
MDLLVKGARVWDDRDLVNIAVTGGTIEAVESGIDGDAARVIDAQGKAVLPGFLEPHLHLDKALLYRRQPARDGTLEEAIRLTGRLKAEQQREDVLQRSRAVLDMAVRSGTTAIRAQPDVDPIQGLIGVETALALASEYSGLLDLQVVAFPQEGIFKAPGTLELMEDAMRMGASVVGGCPYNEVSWEDTKRHVDLVFEVAQRFGAPVDMHADFADDTSNQRFAALGYIAERTIATGYQGRVSLGHVTSLASLTPEEAKPVIDLVAQAGISIITLPATDLYLGGRNDRANVRRGVTPVHLLRDSGVNVAFSSNNIRNAFTPFGKADPLQIGSLLAHVGQFGTPHSQAEILRMATHDAARAMGFDGSYGIGAGKQADFMICDSPLVADVLLDIPVRLYVVKRGRVVVETAYSCLINKNGAAG